MKEIDNLIDFENWIVNTPLAPAAFQSLDLSKYEAQLVKLNFDNCLFLGCELSDETAGYIVKTGGFVVPKNESYSFDVHRSQLYTVSDLFNGFKLSDEDGYKNTLDYKIYKEYLNQGKDKPSNILTSLLRRIHDHSITDAIHELIENKKVVAVMGGHSMERQDPFYLKIAQLSRELTREGYFMVSGGGPGAMEATHLGAYFACRSEDELITAIDEIKIRPVGAKPNREYNDKDWLHRAWRILEKYPLKKCKESDAMSLGIPTWLYGHEPAAPFATHIGKYFANSVREEGLLAIAKHGVIFAPGSAGTTQEIFQDATQNHYGSMGFISPMILFGIKKWTEERPVWNLLQKVAKGKIYGELLALTDSKDEVIRRILSYNPDIYKVE